MCVKVSRPSVIAAIREPMTTVPKNYHLRDIDYDISPTDDPISWTARVYADAPFCVRVRKGSKRVDVIDEVFAEAGYENGVVLTVPRGAFLSVERQEPLDHESMVWLARLVI